LIGIARRRTTIAPVTPPARHGVAEAMTARQPPRRRRLSYGDAPLPTLEETLAAPLSAFPSWYLRTECEHCGRERLLNQAVAASSW